MVIGLWMVAGELLVMARLFDRMEVGLRKVARRVKDTWAHSPNAVKVPVVLGAAGVVFYGIYRLLFSG